MFKTNRYGKKNRIGNLLSISTICIVLIAAFGLLGASFASWSQPFAIFGSITTGHINIIVRDVVLESSDGYESRSFTANKVGDIVDSVDMDVVTDVDPFHSVVVFTVENNGTIPVTCEGVDEIAGGDDVEVQLLESPPKIDVGQTATIKVSITKGYCRDFEFSTFLRFVQAVQ